MNPKPVSAKAFERAILPFERQVYFLCLRMMGNHEDAQDAAQESLLKAFRAFGGFRGESKVSTWLYTIAARCCLDILRSRKQIAYLEDLQDEGWEPESDEPSPYMQLEEEERKRLLQEAVKLLPQDHRAALVLCDLQGLPLQEASEILACPLGTLKSRLFRARRMLRKYLSAQGELFDRSKRPMDEGGERDEL